MYQGVSVDELDRACGVKNRGNVAAKYSGSLQTKNRAYPFTASEDAIPHGLVNGCGAYGCRREEAVERGIDGNAVLFKKWGEIHRCGRSIGHWAQASITIRSLFPARMARPLACRQPSSAKFPRGLPLLPVVSGIRAKAPHLPQRASWRRPEIAVDSPTAAPLPLGGQETSQSPASSRVPVFLLASNSTFNLSSYSRGMEHFTHAKHSRQRRIYRAGFNVRVCFRALATAASLKG